MNFQLVGEHKTDLDSIKLHIENWNIGKVPFTRRHIEGNNKILDALFEAVKQKRFDMMRFANRIDGFLIIMIHEN
jgi:hypothetical protein